MTVKADLTGTLTTRSHSSTNMPRTVWRIFAKARTPLLIGAIFFVGYFSKDLINLENNQLQEDVKNNTSQMRAPTKKPYVYSWPRCQQNLHADEIPGFRLISGQFQDFLHYRHCRHFPMLLDVPDKCGGDDESADVFLLLVIKSTPANYERREVLRKTWAQERVQNGSQIRRIFISGTMGSGLEKARLNKRLKLEQREHNDILQWDFDESLFNLTLKQILFFEWMERNCQRAHFLLNGDDDVFANTDNMVEYLQGLKDDNRSKHLFTGQVIENASPIRWSKSKYFIPFQVDKTISYPLYCGGGGIIMSVHTALVIYNMSQSITIFPIDDVYLGMCLAKAGLAPVSHDGFKTLDWSFPSDKQHDPCYFKENMVLHKLLPADTYDMWHAIHELDLECGDKENNN